MSEEFKSKRDMSPPAPTAHPDPRMHLVLRDMLLLFKDDLPISYPLARSKA